MGYADRSKKVSKTIENGISKFAHDISDCENLDTLFELYYLIRATYDADSLTMCYDNRWNEDESAWKLHLTFANLPKSVCKLFEKVVLARCRGICHGSKEITSKALDEFYGRHMR